MPNYNYQSGRRTEYQVKRRYERAGFTCVRAAGSKGNWDIVAFGEYPYVKLIQVKRVKAQAEAKRLLRQFKATNPAPKGFHRVMEVYVSKTREMLSSEGI